MKRIVGILLVSTFFVLSAFGQKDKFAGFYEGQIEGGKGYPLGFMPNLCAEVYRGAKDTYRVKIFEEKFKRAEPYIEVDNLKIKDGKIEIKNASGYSLRNLDLVFTPEEAIGTSKFGNDVAKITLKKSKFQSPTMGLKAPAGSYVLFDGKDTSKWQITGKPRPFNWGIAHGAMTVETKEKTENGDYLFSNIITKDVFEAVRLHLEFKIPAEYELDSQNRGNSGVFFGPYEIQILDSFGAHGDWGDLGSIYRTHPPIVNAALEPEAWQTLDAEFIPAKFDGEKLIEYPSITVWINGALVQNKMPIYSATAMATAKKLTFKHPRQARIMLQDHRNPVSFRNIWVRDL